MQPAHTHPTMSCIHSHVSVYNIYVFIWFHSKRSVQIPVQVPVLIATIVYYPIAFINNVVVKLTSSQQSV